MEINLIFISGAAKVLAFGNSLFVFDQVSEVFLWLMMGFCVALTFTACGDDDDDDDGVRYTKILEQSFKKIK